METPEAKIFPFGMTWHRKFIIVLNVMAGVMFLVSGVLAVVRGPDVLVMNAPISIIWFAAAYMGYHMTRMPYLRITGQEVAIFRGMIYQPSFCRFDAVEEMKEIREGVLELSLKSGEKILIRLSAIAVEQREEVVALLQGRIAS